MNHVPNWIIGRIQQFGLFERPNLKIRKKKSDLSDLDTRSINNSVFVKKARENFSLNRKPKNPETQPKMTFLKDLDLKRNSVLKNPEKLKSDQKFLVNPPISCTKIKPIIINKKPNLEKIRRFSQAMNMTKAYPKEALGIQCDFDESDQMDETYSIFPTIESPLFVHNRIRLPKMSDPLYSELSSV